MLAVCSDNAVTVCPAVSFIRTYISLVAVLELDTVPNVHVFLWEVTAEFKVTLPPSAQPFVPLPPPPAPARPFRAWQVAAHRRPDDGRR